MARILTSGFEAPFSPAEEGWVRWAGTENTEASSWSAGGRRLWTRGLNGGSIAGTDYGQGIGGERYCTCYASNNSLVQAFKRDIPPTTEAWGRFAYNLGGFPRVGNGRIIEWHLTGVGAICSMTEYDLGSDTNISFNVLSSAGVQLGLVPINTGFFRNDGGWYLIEWHLLLAGSDGKLTIWIDGTKRYEYIGPLAGPGGETTFDSIIIGMGGPSSGQAFNSNARRGYDDIAINDTAGTVNNGRVGDGVILRRVPRFPGGTTQLLSDLGAADPEVNFRRVNRDGDPNGFVGAITPGSKDLYQIGDGPGGESDADGRGMPVLRGYSPAVVFQARGVQNGPAISNIRFAMQPPSQLEFQAPAAPGLALPTAGLNVVNHQIEVNPNTGLPFTQDELEAVQAGFSLEA